MMSSLFSFKAQCRPSSRDWLWLLDRITPQMHHALASNSYCILQNWYDVEDAMQESIIKSVLAHDQLRDESKLFSWMFTIVRRESYAILAKQSPCIPLDRLETISPEAVKFDLEEYWVTTEKYSAVIGFLKEMDTLSRQIVSMKTITDMNLQEVTSHVGANYNTVRSKYYRALSGLRELMKVWCDNENE